MRIKKKAFKKSLIDSNMNQRALAKALGINESYISNIIRKGASEKVLTPIATVLGVELESIAEYEEVLK